MSASLQQTYQPLLEAASFAARAHHGQLRKDGKTPYASHPSRVALVVRDVFEVSDRQIITAALLHDTIEDTTTDFDDLAEKFGGDVALWVAALSKDKRLPETQREAAYMRQLQQAPWQVHVCKLADIFDNLMDCASMAKPARAHVCKRAQSYIEALQAVASPSVQRAMELTVRLLEEMSKNLE